MAIVELVFPHFKKDPEVAQKLADDYVPLIVKSLKEAGIIGGFRGMITTEDGKDVNSDFREILMLEWPSTEYFEAFVASSAFNGFIADVIEKGFVVGPPELKLFEANAGVQVLGHNTVLQILRIEPRHLSTIEEIRTALDNFKGGKAVNGSSLNLDPREVVLVESFPNQAAADLSQTDQDRSEVLKKISKMARITRLVATVEKM